MAVILYAHGFRSSSRSRKVGELRDYLSTHSSSLELIAPDLSFDPSKATAQLDAIYRECKPEDLTVVGSSLGGFYALVLAERYGCRAVLLNPSLRPYETLAAHVGVRTNLYSGETFEFTSAHLDALRAMRVERISRASRYLLIVEMGDELLDHRDTIRFFGGARMIVEPRGDHDLTSFPRHIPALMEFISGR